MCVSVCVCLCVCVYECVCVPREACCLHTVAELQALVVVAKVGFWDHGYMEAGPQYKWLCMHCVVCVPVLVCAPREACRLHTVASAYLVDKVNYGGPAHEGWVLLRVRAGILLLKKHCG